ncbi:MAG: hypothetical protein Q4F49_08000 [Pseudoxanthomonas suwonensis]|nr:hypothetical protein [Pseudoxanthomonas suwonensis]
MTRLHCLLLSLALAGMPPGVVLAQATPQQATENAMRAMRGEAGLPALAAHIHAEELARFRDLLLPAMAPPVDAPAAAHQVAQLMRRDVFGPDIGAGQLQQMDPTAFMRGFLAANQRQMREAGVQFGEWEVIGLLAEDELMHAVVRSRTRSGNAAPVAMLEVVSLRRDDGQWKLLLSPELEGAARMLRAQLPGLD